jgi:hypothetical protein
MDFSKLRRWVIGLGPAAAFGIAAATSSIRDDVGATNVGIVLSIVVVAAALTGRLAGLTTAATAALSFNFFHTEPYHSLRVHESSDVVIIALLAALGVVVSDITAWRHRRDAITFGSAAATGAPRRVMEVLAESHPVSEVWPAVTTMIMDQLRLADCTFAAAPHPGMPLISRAGGSNHEGDGGFVLPAHGAALPLVADGETLGFLVLRPSEGLTSLWVERRVVLALADHLTIALTYTGRRAPSDKPEARNG